MPKILIVVDMQDDFINGALGNKECQEVVPYVCALIEEHEWDHRFITMDSHHDDYKNTLEGKKLPVVHCIESTPGWEIDGNVMDSLVEDAGVVNEESHMIHMNTYINKDTFGSLLLPIEIDMWARMREFDMRNVEIHMCGVCTSICVLANAVLLRTHYPDSKIVVHECATADVTPELKVHAIECLKSLQCEVVP